MALIICSNSMYYHCYPVIIIYNMQPVLANAMNCIQCVLSLNPMQLVVDTVDLCNESYTVEIVIVHQLNESCSLCSNA